MVFACCTNVFLVFIYITAITHICQNQLTWCRCEQNVTLICQCANSNMTGFGMLTGVDPFLCQTDNIIHDLTNITKFILPDYSSIQGDSFCSWNNTRKLTLSNSSLTHLTSENLSPFPNLVLLNLSRNLHLVSYGDGVFEGIGEQLITLVLQSNPVRSITFRSFSGLKSLLLLDLSDNKIEHIGAGVFLVNCCTSLRELRLDRNQLTVLDSHIFQGLHNLRVLDLRENPLQKLDSHVFHPTAPTLTELYMSNRHQVPFGGFDSPPDDLFVALQNLRILHMDGLKMTNLTKNSFRGLKNLRVLSIRGNHLVTLPPDIFSIMKELEELDLSENSLHCISSSLIPDKQSDFLSTLPLRWIDLSHNRLTHMNHLTAKSLSLFDSPSPDQPRLLLNLTGNPWQHFDEDSFCDPKGVRPIRPTDIVVGPSDRVWRTSLGLWFARSLWPEGPLSLIGPRSYIYGLLLGNSSVERRVDLSSKQKAKFGHDYALFGTLDSIARCQQFKGVFQRSADDNKLSHSYSGRKVELPNATLLAYSVSSHCPRLSTRILMDWELRVLEVPNHSINHELGFTTPISTTDERSRFYLLIIVSLCITFLLIALTVIMCYRAWSRRSAQECSKSEFTVFPTDYGQCVDKQLLVKYEESVRHADLIPSSSVDVIDSHPFVVDQPSVDIVVDNLLTFSGLPLGSPCTNMCQSPSSTLSSRTKYLWHSRPKSDSEVNSSLETPKLTVFGVI